MNQKKKRSGNLGPFSIASPTIVGGAVFSWETESIWKIFGQRAFFYSSLMD